MVIKRSSAREVSNLLQDLEHGAGTTREAAAARLSVIGTRAVEGLLALVASTPVQPARLAAFSALEAIADPRAADSAFGWLEQGNGPTASSAAGVLRRLLDSPRGTEILDRLTAIALDVTRPEGARVAAMDALREMPASVTGPVRQRLAADPSAGVRAAAETSASAEPRPSPMELLEESAEGALPDPPGRLKAAVLEAGGVAPLPTLHRLVGVLRDEEEKSDTIEARRREWMTVRAAVHLALAERGSTVALYDLRETIERAAGGPVELLAALERVGDASCLEAIAAAHARLAGAEGGERWWREHLVTAFRSIMGRERLTERHAALRRIKARWPESAAGLLPPRA